MKAIKNTSFGTVESAQEAATMLSKAAAGKGFLFGYYDQANRKIVFFEEDVGSIGQLRTEQERVEIQLPMCPVVPAVDNVSTSGVTMPIGRMTGQANENQMQSFRDK